MKVIFVVKLISIVIIILHVVVKVVRVLKNVFVVVVHMRNRCGVAYRSTRTINLIAFSFLLELVL